MKGTELLRGAVAAFERGEMSAADYKKISGGFGTYAERGDRTHMLRLRLAGGEADRERLSFIAGAAKRHGAAFLHITTCQTIQLHGLSAGAVCTLIDEAAEAGIRTRGCGGDHPRNVMASPLSGVDPDEYFDVTPYVRAADAYLAELDDKVKLPRKLKAAFESSEKNETHATFRDIGFMARPDGGFDVYTCGGLGVSPKLGLLTAENIDPADVLAYIHAMVMTFVEHGNYKNRARARTRFMRDELGDERYISEYMKNLKKAFGEGIKKVSPEKAVFPEPDGAAPPEGEMVFPQKQKGLYAVRWIPVGGIVAAELMSALADAVSHSRGAALRLVPGGGAYVINCTAGEAREFMRLTEADTAVWDIERSTACIGSSVCRTGIRDSQELLRNIIAAAKAAGLAPKSLPPVRISGCPSSCGAHQSGVIGFQGRVKKDTSGALRPAFAVYVNGSGRMGEERLGEAEGVVFSEDIPRMMTEIGRAAGDDFFAGYEENIAAAKKIAAEYAKAADMMSKK